MSTRGGADTREVSIVIVDDEDDLRGAVAEHLGDEGYRVSGVANAAAFRGAGRRYSDRRRHS